MATLAVLSGEMDSGVSKDAAPKLLQLKRDLASAADSLVRCEAADANPAELGQRFTKFLEQAAPGMKRRNPSQDDDDKPEKGLYGNDVTASVSAFAGPPSLLSVQLDASVPCGNDGQLLVYERRGGE